MPSGKAVSVFSPSSHAGEGPDLVTHNPWLFPNHEPRKSWKKIKNKNHRAGSDFLPEEGRHLVNSPLPVSEWMLCSLLWARPWEHTGEPRPGPCHWLPTRLDGEDGGHLKGNRSVSPGYATRSGYGQGYVASATLTTSAPGVWFSARGTRSAVNIC